MRHIISLFILQSSSFAARRRHQQIISFSSMSSKSEKKRKRAVEQQQQPWFSKFTQDDPLYIDYMSSEWGFEKQTEEELFEKLSLEGAQSGLSWRTILHKREAYRKAFHGFHIDKVAAMTESDVERLLSKKSNDSTQLVVRHRGKLESVINNAAVIQKLKTDGTIYSLKEYLWSFVNNQPILNQWQSLSDMPSKTDESECMSKALKKHGFKFVGPTTCYAFMQSCGFVIDHPVGTKHWAEAEKRLKKRKGGYQIR